MDREWLRYIRKMLCKDKCFMMEEKTQKEIAALIDAALAEPSDADVAEAIEWTDRRKTLLGKAIGHMSFENLHAVSIVYDSIQDMQDELAVQKTIVQALRQYQKPTDTKILAALSWFEDMGNHEIVHRIKQQPDYISTMPDTVIETIVTALRQMRTEPDCSTAEWQGGYCLGYGKSDTDDEPCDVCKACPKQASYDDDKCEWCDKNGPETWNYTRSGKYIPEYQTPRNYCRACGRKLVKHDG